MFNPRNLAACFVILSCALPTVSGHAQDGERSFSYAAHGTLFDAERRPIKVTPSFIEKAQQNLLKRAEERATPEARKRFAEIQEKLRDADMDPLHQAFTNAGLVRLLASSTSEEEAEKGSKLTLLGENAGLTRQIRSAYGAPLNWKMNMRDGFDPFVFRIWGELDLLDWIIVDLSAFFENPYIKDCREAGVPVPAFYGGTGWTKSTLDADGNGPLLQGELDDEFILSNLKAIVWGWQSNDPRGSCIALPRGSGTSAGISGVICQANDTPDACFFDNLNPDQSPFTVNEGDVIPMKNFATGPQLAAWDGPTGTCPECHRGENAFIIHPGTALDLTAQGYNLRAAGGWYVPRFGPNAGPEWENPPPTDAFDAMRLGTTTVTFPLFAFNISVNVQDRGCNACHQLPSLQSGDEYCSSFLQQATERTMPPPTDPPANWNTMESLHDVSFEKHINALRAECGLPPSTRNPSIQWLTNPEN